MRSIEIPLRFQRKSIWCLYDLTPFDWCKTDAHSMDFGKVCACIYFNFPFTIKLAISLNVFQQDPSPLGRILLSVSLLNSFHQEGLLNSVMTSCCSNNIKVNLFLKHGLISRTYFKKSLIMASIFGSESKSFMTMSIPPQGEPSINQPVTKLKRKLNDFDSHQEKRLSSLGNQLKEQQDENRNSSSLKRVHFVNTITNIRKEDEPKEEEIKEPNAVKDNNHNIIDEIEENLGGELSGSETLIREGELRDIKRDDPDDRARGDTKEVDEADEESEESKDEVEEEEEEE
nr:hypothetical protein [Tanacetum cinerariifolium]